MRVSSQTTPEGGCGNMLDSKVDIVNMPPGSLLRAKGIMHYAYNTVYILHL